jgi:anaerobic magnesium-protoporphyrin IX monomethyl ester cyclase
MFLSSETDMPYDIVLINAHRDFFFAVQDAISIGTNLLATLLRTTGFRVGYFRGFAQETAAWLENELKIVGARSVGFYCDYENVSLVEELCRKVKSLGNIPVIVGGPQAFTLTEDFFRHSGCDFAIRGEAEEALSELLDYLLKGQGDPARIAGIHFLGFDGQLVSTKDRDLRENLDDLPFADFTLDRRWPYQISLPILSGRGCPYQCAFCFQGGNTKKVRYRSVKNVMEEIGGHFAHRPGLKSIYFVDDTFTLNRERMEQFCGELAALRKKYDFVWYCQGHVQTILRYPGMMRTMVDAGMVKMLIGIESGSDEMLRLYRKQATVAQIKTAVECLVQAGVKQVEGNIILGGPGESLETAEASLQLVLGLIRTYPGIFFAGTYFLFPYPGTEITGNPARFGLKFLPERILGGLDDVPHGETETLSTQRLFEIRRYFMQQVVSAMHQQYVAGRIPSDSVVGMYRLAYQYGIASRWLLNLMRRLPIADRYYSLLAAGGASLSEGISRWRLGQMRPQRVFEIWNTVSFSEGFPEIDGFSLSPLEYDLICASSGKQPLEEMMQKLFRKYAKHYSDLSEFRETLLDILKSFEKKCWLVYSAF